MQVTFDVLSLVLLAGILLLAAVHLLLLRKPEPSTHPLLLGRQSELSRVRKPNESPAFISATAGLGGLAKQLLKGARTIQETWHGKGSNILIGMSQRPDSLDEKVYAMRSALGEDVNGPEPLKIKLDDPADAFLTLLAATATSSSIDQVKLPVVLNGKEALLANATSPLAAAPIDLPLLRDVNSKSSGSDRRMVLVHPAQQLPQQPQVTKSEGWNVKDIYVEELYVKGFNAASQPALEASEQSPKEAFRMTISSKTVEGTAEVTHQNLLHGGVLSVLSMFPANEKLTKDDRVLSFENTSTPYGLAVALAGAATGATLRLCSPSKGIVTKCRSFSPSVIFCTPNELNAIRTSLKNFLPKGGAVVPLAYALKKSLLRSGSVSKTTFWDRFIFQKIARGVVGQRLRCIVVSSDEEAGPSSECVEYLRVVLGIPIIVTLTHPLVVGPVTNTLYNDFQSFPSDGLIGHVGCPSATVECKLLDVDEEQVKQDIYRGELAVKGPSVIRTLIRAKGSSDPSTSDGWTKTGIWAELRTNGTLKVIKKL